MGRTLRTRLLGGVGAALATAAAVAVLAGCGIRPLGPRDGDDVAHDAARERADQIAAAIDEGRPRNVLASDFAYRYSDAADGGWTGTPGEYPAEFVTEAISWDGMTRDAGGARFVLRISAHVGSRSTGFGGADWSDGDWTGCFGYEVHAFFEWRTTRARQQACPAASLTPPPAPLPAPELPDDAVDQLKAVLAAATAATLADDLEAAFPDDLARRDPVTGAHLTRDSAVEGAVLGAAVGISGTKECVLGTRAADGTVNAGTARPITLESGEAGCTASNALHPVTTH
jgi:hypothetical protein